MTIHRRAAVMAAAALAILLAGDLVPLRPAAALPGTSAIGSDYRKDPYLSAEQKQILNQLAERSGTPLAAESWPHGRAVGRMELSVPSGAPTGKPLADHALTFVTANRPLWNISTTAQVGVVKVVPAGTCSTVTLTLTATATPVFNATITVVLTPTGTVRGVAGHLSGAPLGEVAPLRKTAAQAVTAARKYIAERSGGPAGEVPLPAPTEVVVDPYFLTDKAHAAGRGWLFSHEAGGTGQAPVIVVNGQSGLVTVAGPGITLPNQIVVGCRGSNPTKVLVPYVLDPMTRTPAIVQFGPQGMATQGATATERAYNLMSQQYMMDMYGDRDPRRHLKDPVVRPGVGGRTVVRFREYYGGLPVEGAQLTVSLLPNGNADLVTARFVYFPHARVTASVPQADAVTAATARYKEIECGTDAACRAAVDGENLAQPPVVSLTILSSEIYVGTKIPTLPPNQERLSYKVEFPRRVVFWDATDNVELFDYPTASNAIPHTITNVEQNNRIEIVDGVAPPGVTPHNDSVRMSNWLGAIDTFYLGQNWNSFDNMGTRLTVRVRAPIANAFWCPAPAVVACGSRMTLGINFTSDDITAHEFTHGLVEFSAGLNGGGEPGALNEHYADVMASVIFPDQVGSGWLLGENSINGAIRNLANPAAFGHPEHYALLTTNCSSPASCVHSWAGVPNRAAVLIADGGVPGSQHPGVGRATMAKLYFQTLTTMMNSSDLFVTERVNTLAVCGQLVGTTIAGRPLTQADCDHVAKAFETVGVVPYTEMGWTRFSAGLFGSHTEVSIRQGLQLYRMCTISNQTLLAHDDSGEIRSSDIADGLVVNFHDEWGAAVTFRASATDATQRAVTYRMWTNWFDEGVVDVLEDYTDQNPPVSDADCRTKPGTTTRTMYGTTRVSHGPSFILGGKGDDVVNPGRSLPVGCEIATVHGVHYHDWGTPEGAAGADLNHEGEHGFRINRFVTGPRALETSVHWWYEAFTSIKVRVKYVVHQDIGTDCMTTGLQDNP